jgi:type VI secretion system secreted protein Hcp
MDETRRLVSLRTKILWIAAALALIAIPAVIGLVAFRGDDSSSSSRRAGALVPATSTATEYHLLLTQGVSGGPEFKDAIALDAFSWGVENPTTIGSATGGAGVGKAKFNEFRISKKVDNASPAFFKQLASGAHFKKAVLTLRKPGEQPYMAYTFETVFITKVDHSGSSPELPTEEVAFVYGKLVVQSFGKTASGVSSPVTHGWDQVLNKSADAPVG